MPSTKNNKLKPPAPPAKSELKQVLDKLDSIGDDTFARQLEKGADLREYEYNLEERERLLQHRIEKHRRAQQIDLLISLSLGLLICAVQLAFNDSKPRREYFFID